MRFSDFLLTRRATRYEGVLLPPPEMRFCGRNFQDDAHFVATGKAEAQRLTSEYGLRADTPILDVGCGSGRLPIGILSTIGDLQHYRGIDVSARSIKWCQRYIGRNHPGAKFTLIDTRNERYNPVGSPITEAFRLPFSDTEFKIVYLYSVFSHMMTEDCRAYLREFARLTAPGGHLFFTTFAEDDVPDVTENPKDYRQDWGDTPLHCVRYNKDYISSLVTEAGFRIERVDYGTETDGQTAFYAVRA